MIALIIGTLVSLSCLFFWLSCEALISANRYTGAASGNPFVDIDLTDYDKGIEKRRVSESKRRRSASANDIERVTADLQRQLQQVDTESVDLDLGQFV